MDAAGLRALQAPIKDRYKSEPQAALITLRAHGTLDDSNIACKVETGRALPGEQPSSLWGRPWSSQTIPLLKPSKLALTSPSGDGKSWPWLARSLTL
jgi:hypothetical protein